MTRGPLPKHIATRSNDWFVLAVDLLALLGVPVLLVFVQVGAPGPFQSLVTYSSQEPTLHGLFGHWTVHYSGLHLLENLTGYGVVVVMGYILAWLLQERWWFRLSMFTILLVVPPLTMMVSLLCFGAIEPGLSYTSRGASAVIAALLGLLYGLSVGFVRELVDLRAAISIGGAMLILALTGLLSQIGSPSPVVFWGLLSAVAIILVLDSGVRLRHGSLSAVRWPAIGMIAVVGYGVTMAMFLVFGGLFPADPFAGDTITNVFSHAAGFALGAIITFWGHRYWTGDSWV
ncbi:hypothetical protein [Halodesulfurarchaeum sp.]|uniref:hypothetical protein n=1 Tax=Halodesulfurarchaeum sp. TaxID=1980530 RepID=UPI002FC38D0D